MKDLSTYISNCCYQIRALRKRRDLVNGEMGMLVFLEEKNTRKYKLLEIELRALDASLVSLALDYELAKDLERLV